MKYLLTLFCLIFSSLPVHSVDLQDVLLGIQSGAQTNGGSYYYVAPSAGSMLPYKKRVIDIFDFAAEYGIIDGLPAAIFVSTNGGQIYNGFTPSDLDIKTAYFDLAMELLSNGVAFVCAKSSNCNNTSGQRRFTA